MSSTEKQKQSLYFSEDMLREIMLEANRLDRSLSWTVQQAWRVARQEVQRFPSMESARGAPQAAPPRPALPRPAARAADDRPREPSAQVREFLKGRFDREANG